MKVSSGRWAAGTVFLSSWLLFAVQPMSARTLLPGLGGSAQVWNSCMMFFQLMLLLGYLYVHLATRMLTRRGQALVHVLLLVAASFLLPTGQPAGALSSGAPVLEALGFLTASVGLPFLALAATAPLVQRWFSRSPDGRARDPYFLFAASNAGSLAALLAYPFLIEPFAGLHRQAQGFRWGFGLFAALLIGSAMAAWKSAGLSAKQEPPAEATAAPSLKQGLHWLALACVPSSLLLGITSHMAQELPSLPLLWIVPLALYLLSFVLVFARRLRIPHTLCLKLQPLLISIVAIVVFVPISVAGFSFHLAAFFVSALVLHGELEQRKPAAGQLTVFYLWIAAGGALGGVLNALIAPLLFSFVAEYPVALVLACLLRPWKGEGRWARRSDLLAGALLAGLTIAALQALPTAGDDRDVVARILILFVAAVVAHYFRKRPLRLGLGIAAVLLSGFIAFPGQGTVAMARSYYGVYRLTQPRGTTLLQMFHGTTVHGAQNQVLAGGPPISYYSPESPVGQVFAQPQANGPGRRFGVVGLGVGALSWYLEPAQSLCFFEIDALVEDLAQRYFSYLAASQGTVEVVIGDGRLMLAGEPDGGLDLLVIDAFASDAVPIHLVTREAVQSYLRKLAPGGAVLFHTSSRHLDLDALLAAIAVDLGVESRTCIDGPLNAAQRKAGLSGSSWTVLSRTEPELVAWTAGDARWTHFTGPSVPVWTDRYSSLLHLLRW